MLINHILPRDIPPKGPGRLLLGRLNFLNLDILRDIHNEVMIERVHLGLGNRLNGHPRQQRHPLLINIIIPTEMQSHHLHLLANLHIETLQIVLLAGHVDRVVVVGAEVVVRLAIGVGVCGGFLGGGGLALLLEVVLTVHFFYVFVDLFVAELAQPQEPLQRLVDVLAVYEELGAGRAEDLAA